MAPAFGIGQVVLVAGDKHIYGNALYAGEEFLQVFPLPLMGGDAATALRGPSPSVVLTESMARSLFGKEDALNKMVRFGTDVMKVTAVSKAMKARIRATSSLTRRLYGGCG